MLEESGIHGMAEMAAILADTNAQQSTSRPSTQKAASKKRKGAETKNPIGLGQ